MLPSPPPEAADSLSTRQLQEYPPSQEFLLKYRIEHELGSGGFGFVLYCIRIQDNVPVACKFIIKSRIPRSSWTLDADLGTCPMEAVILKNVSHPHIISFLDYMHDEQYCYLITELHGCPWNDDGVKNGVRRPAMDLFECIEQHTRFSEAQGRYIFRQVVEAVVYLYSLGLVHRDIKDENLLIDDKFHVRLIDFGSCSFFDTTGTRTFDRFLGTIQYASPEILRGQPYHGPEAEVWALGCCLYIILTGQVPFATANQAMNHTFTTPNVTLSPSCRDLLRRMLARDVSQRATINEVMNHAWLSMRP
ncbi:kinase-like domain-containing protein [Gorgonomyces haynaldii]|nr:kinase-like domain-containing protein [Gorgonomyces haynaldii]